MKFPKRPKQKLQWLHRALTAGRRALPSCLIIGAAKSGTTSLYSYLGQHPNILRGYSQEVHYFDGGLDPKRDSYARGERWYRKHFPLIDDMGEGDVTFESSPLYLYNPLAAERIFGLLPEARLIALLRNPTERAISHYFHERRRGREPLELDAALAAEEARLRPALARGDFKDAAFIHLSYKKRGLYCEQIERFRQYFPDDQIMIVGHEELFADPQSGLRRIFAFVGVDPDFAVPALRPHNVGGNRQDVDPAIRHELDAFFAPHNRRLYDLTGTDFGW